MSHSQKISSFTGQALLDNADLFTFVRSSTNFNVSFSDFKNELGVTGTLNQVGDPLGVPVLDQPGGNVNNIRNIEASKGILASVSPQDGITLEWNIAQDLTGVSITSGLTNAQPVLSSFLPGAGMQITKVNDVITFTATGAALPATKAVTVNQESDLPTASGGIIQGEADTVYIISNNFSTANEFHFGDNSSVVSYSKESPVWTYTGTGTMFTGLNVSVAINELKYDCPNGKAHDFSETGGGNTKSVNISNSRLISCVDYGTFDSLFFAVIFNSDCFSNTTTGPVFLGTGWALISMNRFALSSLSATYVGVDLGASTSDAIELTDLLVAGPSGAVGVTGLVSSGNITSGNLATIADCNFGGAITPITNIAPVTDVRWASRDNDGIGNSRDDSLISIQSNTSETVIALAGTPVKMVGTWTDEGSSRFTVTAIGGRMAFAGERPMRLPINATISIVGASGGDKQVSAYIAINGSVVTATKIEATASSSKAGTINLLWQHDFQPNDFVEMFLANESDTTNVIGQSAVARID